MKIHDMGTAYLDFDYNIYYILSKANSMINKLYQIFYNLFTKKPLEIPPKSILNLTQITSPGIKQTTAQDLDRKLKINIQLENGNEICFQKTEGMSGEEVRDNFISYVDALEISKELKDIMINNSHQGIFVNVLSALNDQRQNLQEELCLEGKPQDFNFKDSPLVEQEITHILDIEKNSLKINLKIGFYFSRKKENFFHTKVHCNINANKKQIDFLFNEIEI